MLAQGDSHLITKHPRQIQMRDEIGKWPFNVSNSPHNPIQMEVASTFLSPRLTHRSAHATLPIHLSYY